MEQIYVKKTASEGIAVAPVYKYQEPDWTADGSLISGKQIPEELEKFREARETVLRELENLADGSALFAAHRELAGDIALQESVTTKICTEQNNAQLAVERTIGEFAVMFEHLADPYMRERSEDIQDIGKRLMACLKGVRRPDLGNLREETIVVARDLYPSDTVKIDPAVVKGIITEEGGVNSHVSILAKSMNIPTLVGVTGILEKLENGRIVCMDAEQGRIVLDPDPETLTEYQDRKEERMRKQAERETFRNQSVVTKDGKRIFLCANVGTTEEIRKALPVRIDGIGLFRTELLYMESGHFPTEEEQYSVYMEAAKLCPGELTIRTLDIGGDKSLPYFKIEKEENPFLGWRGIRISLEQRDLFKVQLRAILRASAFGHVRIMFPMIISPEEFRAAKEMVEECKGELRKEGISFDETVETGMMMETPASVLLAEEFAKEADFFSIGTNDLTQYLLAADRGNKKTADRYNYFHPAVLRAIRQIIDAGHREGIRVGMCGEMAGDRRAAELLLEMGLDEFSMAAGSVDAMREILVKATGKNGE